MLLDVRGLEDETEARVGKAVFREMGRGLEGKDERRGMGFAARGRVKDRRSMTDVWRLCKFEVPINSRIYSIGI